jgi:hypothetical protein
LPHPRVAPTTATGLEFSMSKIPAIRADDLDDALAPVRLPAVDRLLLLMNRVKIAELTMPEVLGLVAVFEAADQRVNAAAAPVLTLIAPRDGDDRQL